MLNYITDCQVHVITKINFCSVNCYLIKQQFSIKLKAPSYRNI